MRAGPESREPAHAEIHRVSWYAYRMRHLGIDYGTKRVGIAASDETGTMAFPRSVLPNNSDLLATIKEICSTESISAIVVGESRDYRMQPNPIMKEASAFSEKLARETGLPVLFEQEFMTTLAAERIQGKGDMIDASAAALILQTYLDRKKNKSSSDSNT